MAFTLSTALTRDGRAVERSWRRVLAQRRLYTGIILLLLAWALIASLRYADNANAGSFLDRLPHFFDFTSWLLPQDWNDVWRALLDIATPHDTGSEMTNYPVGRVYLFGDVYLPQYFYLMLITLNVALLSTVIGFVGGGALCFLAARNLMTNRLARGLARRTAEICRAFPEIVIAGLFAAILSIGPIAAVIAVGIHTIGALGKLFYEVVENIDMKANEGLEAVGANWLLRVRYGVIPHVMPNFISYALLRLEINVRASTIIGAVGGGGIGQELRLSISRGFGPKTIALVGLLLVTVIAVDQISALLRRKLVGDQSFVPVP
jgi:phosphonate transport system permease protein